MRAASPRSPARASPPRAASRPSVTHKPDSGRGSGPRSSPPPRPSGATRSSSGTGTSGGAAWLRTPQPNAGHRALARLEGLVPEFTLVTQNVDGLHLRAGSRRVIELHGNIHRSKCFDEDILVEDGVDCARRPAAVPAMRRASPTRRRLVRRNASAASTCGRGGGGSRCDLLFSIGTSAAVFPAAQFPVKALQSGAMVVEINKDRTPLTGVATFSLLGRRLRSCPSPRYDMASLALDARKC